jgi:phosphatidylglycerophosphate synthase
MQRIKNHIPILLIYSRLLIGIIILLLSIIHINNFSSIAIGLFSIGLLTDIFDGIVARKLNISTQKLRRLDSTVDQIFFVLIAIATFIECKQFFYTNYLKLIILLGAEGLTYLICFLKFKKEIATHSISSKIWTLILFATLIQIIATFNSTILFQWCFYIGLATRLEIVIIILFLPKWTNDVPSLYHAVLIRQGKEIKRHKLFNG